MSDPTPTPEEALSSTADVKNVKVDVVETVPIKESMPTIAKLAHVLAILVSGVIALCVSSVLADGNSVIVLKDVAHLPRITKYELKKSHGLDYRADECAALHSASNHLVAPTRARRSSAGSSARPMASACTTTSRATRGPRSAPGRPFKP